MCCRKGVMWNDKLYQNQGLGTWYLYVDSGKILEDFGLTMSLYALC